MANSRFTFASNKNIIMLALLFIVCLLNFQESLAASSLGFRGAKEKAHSTHQVNSNLNSNFNPQLNINEVDEIVLPDEQILINKLLKYYDPAARPVYNASQPVVVRFSFALIQICDMDERNQIITTNVWLEQEWFDERLIWNSSEYNRLDKIRLPCNRIWLPDIVLYNSADDYTDGYMQSKAMVKPDGNVFWSPPAKLRSSCKIDVTYFPFDDQICFIKFGSWSYSGLQVDLVNRSITIDLTNYVESGEWDLKSVIVERNVQYYPCCPEEPYPDLIFYVFIRRRILYYLFNIILPCIWLSILNIIGFWLPPDSGEKITLGITVLLAFSVFMLMIAENIPATSETVPLIGIYLTLTMALTSLSIILTVLVLQIHYTGSITPEISKGLYSFLTKTIANRIGMAERVRLYETKKQKITIQNASSESKKKSNKIYQIETSLVDCHNSINSIKSDLKNLNQISLTKSSSFKHKNMNKVRTINEMNESFQSKKLEIFIENEAKSREAEKLNNGRKLEILENELESVIPIYKYETINDNIKSRISNNKRIKPRLMNGSIPLSNQNKENSDNLDECIKRIDIFSTNIQKYIEINELQDKDNIKKLEWKLIAEIIDRFLFWTFLIITVFSSILLLIIIPLLKNKYF